MKNIIKQCDSIISSVKDGKDFDNQKIPNKVIQKSLEFETLFYGIEGIKIYDSFSDYPPSYTLVLKIKNPYSKTDLVIDNYNLTMEIFPEKNGYRIRDYRLLNSVKNSKNSCMSMILFNNVRCKTLIDLVERLFSSELSLSVYGMMNVKGVKSGEDLVDNYTLESLQNLHRDEKFEDFFDFDKNFLKEQLLMKINGVLLENEIGTIKNK